jgi:hypothetical protein
MAIDVDTSGLPAEFRIRLDVVLQTGERAELGTIAGRRGDAAKVPDAPTLRDDVRGILQRLGLNALDEQGDDAILERIKVQGRKVLVLGAGLGEMSRAARARGAAIVDGVEPDPNLAQAARLLNAYHHVSRVSIFEREIAQPDAYSEPYDIVLVLSPFDLVVGVLDKLAGITDGVLVTTLPDLDKGLAVIGASFQHHEVLDADNGLVVVAHSREVLGPLLRAGEPVTQATQ